ncbi:hypothetical protein NG798_05500 [Ancylothrix sp. C2]|uniref:hypothetical protein n=1 Tax=Ancylothrix sp. D3o TaxID=2953691 RepID=UPI0021BB86F4|nr:hypothetical protein [Ancylothrix sp. D3o]MCT7949236.1 hypothetical protein [Ancylothrix sp. D3o]
MTQQKTQEQTSLGGDNRPPKSIDSLAINPASILGQELALRRTNFLKPHTKI